MNVDQLLEQLTSEDTDVTQDNAASAAAVPTSSQKKPIEKRLKDLREFVLFLAVAGGLLFAGHSMFLGYLLSSVNRFTEHLDALHIFR